MHALRGMAGVQAEAEIRCCKTAGRQEGRRCEMVCASLKNNEACVPAESADAFIRMKALQAQKQRMILTVTEPVSPDYVWAAGYNPMNRLHIFHHLSSDGAWTAPLLSTAERCGIQSAVTFYPIIPGIVSCAALLERVSALRISPRTMYLFMFPYITVPVDRNDDGYMIGGRQVKHEYLENRCGRYLPSAEYIGRFMRKVHKYLDCTAHPCGICGRDCSLCSDNENPA